MRIVGAGCFGGRSEHAKATLTLCRRFGRLVHHHGFTDL